ncbi:MAG: homoserine dehydrogenase, partial [Synechocystis sp.]
MTVKIGLLGLGTVGTGTVEILQDPQGRNPLIKAIEIQRVGVRSLDKPRQVDLPASVVTTDLEAVGTVPERARVGVGVGGLDPARSVSVKAIAHHKH